MKLTAFKIINCFGFRDSGWLNLEDEHSFIYLLGRNSSGKSSVLNAIKYFEWGVTPSEKPNFHNFNDSGETRALIAKYELSGSALSEEQFRKELLSKLAELRISSAAMNSNPKLKNLFETLLAIYGELISQINAAGHVKIWKMSDGHYHYVENGNDQYLQRKKSVEAAIEAAKDGNGNFNLSGSSVNIPLAWSTVEDILFRQSPNIYLFDEKFSLREVLPERINWNWEGQKNQFLNTFVDYLGKEKTQRYLRSNDPEEREGLLLELRERVKALTDRVNQYRADSLNTDLLEITLHDKDGIQITVRTDGKKSYYAHLSDNTKFLFAYYLYQETNNISGDILLFDEPSNGFHPTAQTFVLNFLKQLAADGNLVIVATHSEYLIDLDYLSSVRLMSTDENKNIIVKNHFYNQAKEKGDYLALKPILDAIGYKYGNQIDIKDKVIVTEGVTDLLYLRAFNKILGFADDIYIAPARGDGTILNVIPFLFSQGINFKVVIDTGTVKKKIQSSFGIEDKFIFEIPIPPEFVGRMQGSGIEDLFTKSDFEKRLSELGHTPTAEFPHVSNSHYMSSGAMKAPGAKRLVAQRLYEMTSVLSEGDFDAETIENFRRVLSFCKNADWYSL